MRTVLLIVVASAALLAGCGNASPCHRWCSWQQQCLNSGLDVESCASSCEARDEGSADHQNRAEACADCLDGKVCTEATSSCASLCLFL